MRFKFVGGNLCLDFINTAGEHLAAKHSEYLKTYDDLLAWGIAAKIFDEAERKRLLKRAELEPAKADQTLKKAIKLREILFQILVAVSRNEVCPSELLKALNKYLTEALKHLQIEQANKSFAFEWKDSENNFEQLIWIVTWSAANLLAHEDLKFLKLCADNSCGWLFLDTSKNKKRTWCDMKDCGNRNKVRQFYSRNKSAD